MAARDRAAAMRAIEMIPHPVRLAREADIARIWAEAEQADLYGARKLGGCLLVPLMRNGIMRNLQVINPDGSKRFATHGKTAGCYFMIGKPSGVIFVAADYEVAVAVHEATGWACAVAFTDQNFPHVARKLWLENPGIVIVVVADPGNTQAAHAAAAVGGRTVSPSIEEWSAAT